MKLDARQPPASGERQPDPCTAYLWVSCHWVACHWVACHWQGQAAGWVWSAAPATMGFMTTTELGEFLRTRRARIQPEDVGLRSYGARRVPGLRREELAHLAGVSPTYYTRLEQSATHNASDGVIDSLARALELTDDEREHLRRLARPQTSKRSTRRPRPEVPRLSVRSLVASLTQPAVVLDHCNEVLAWNPIGHRLLGYWLPFDQPEQLMDRPNLARMFFLDPESRDLYVDWCQVARDMTAWLRYSSGQHPDDPRLTALVGELAQRNDEFAGLWSRHLVRDCGYGIKRLHHPVVGGLDLDCEVMPIADSNSRLAIYHAPEGSAAADALTLLAH